MHSSLSFCILRCAESLWSHMICSCLREYRILLYLSSGPLLPINPFRAASAVPIHLRRVRSGKFQSLPFGDLVPCGQRSENEATLESRGSFFSIFSLFDEFIWLLHVQNTFLYKLERTTPCYCQLLASSWCRYCRLAGCYKKKKKDYPAVSGAVFLITHVTWGMWDHSTIWGHR